MGIALVYKIGFRPWPTLIARRNSRANTDAGKGLKSAPKLFDAPQSDTARAANELLGGG
jgi:hypothetical protein